MSALDTLKGRLELKSFENEALGTVYYKPITAREQDEIGLGNEKIPMGKKLVKAVLMKALDSEGNRLFKDSDEKELMTLVKSEDIGDLANGVIASKSVEEQLGE